MTVVGYPVIQGNYPNEVEHRRKITQVLNGAMQGKLNAVTTLTLTAAVGSTTLSDARITSGSFIWFMPTTANAAAEIGNGTMFVPTATMKQGSAAITHANNAQVDRTFVVLIIG